jgi:hypothetical protein
MLDQVSHKQSASLEHPDQKRHRILVDSCNFFAHFGNTPLNGFGCYQNFDNVTFQPAQCEFPVSLLKARESAL